MQSFYDPSVQVKFFTSAHLVAQQSEYVEFRCPESPVAPENLHKASQQQSLYSAGRPKVFQQAPNGCSPSASRSRGSQTDRQGSARSAVLELLQLARARNRNPVSFDGKIGLEKEDTKEKLLCLASSGVRELPGWCVADLLWSMAKLGIRADPQVRDGILAAAVLTCQSFRLRDLGKTAWALGRLVWQDEGLLEAIAAGAAPGLAEATTQEIASLAWGFAKVSTMNLPLMEAIACTARERIAEFCPRNLSILVWSVATLSFQARDFLEELSAASIGMLPEFNHQDLTQAAWSWATLRILDVPLLTAVAESLMSRSSDGTPQDLTNTAWALAKMAVNNVPFFEFFTHASLRNLRHFDPQNIANAVWSLATIVCRQAQFCDAVAAHSVANVEHFGMQEVANVAWAMAHLAFVDAPLMHALARKAMVDIPRSCEQNMTNIVWAYAQLKFGSTPLFRCVSREIIGRVGALRARDISITAWSFARMEIRDDDLIDALSKEALQKLEVEGCWGAQELSNLMWSFAVLDVRHKCLLESVAKATFVVGPKDFKTQELTNMLWAYATLRYQQDDLISCLAIEATRNLAQYSVQNLVSAAWALQVLSWYKLDTQAATLREMLRCFAEIDHGSAPGVECVLMAGAVEQSGPELLTSPGAAALLAHTRKLILEPTFGHLRRLLHARNSRELECAHEELQVWVEKMQIPHLGPVYTRAALAEVSISEAARGSSWPTEARESIAEAAWWSCPHAAVSSQGVVAWCSWSLRAATGMPACDSAQLLEPGRVFFADDSAESVLIGRMLQPVYLQVQRGSHAERRALLELLRSIIREMCAGTEGPWLHVEGIVRLYASHYPCISCLASLSRFQRLLPNVHVEMEFEDASVGWKERLLTSVPSAKLRMGRTSCRVEETNR